MIQLFCLHCYADWQLLASGHVQSAFGNRKSLSGGKTPPNRITTMKTTPSINQESALEHSKSRQRNEDDKSVN